MLSWISIIFLWAYMSSWPHLSNPWYDKTCSRKIHFTAQKSIQYFHKTDIRRVNSMIFCFSCNHFWRLLKHVVCFLHVNESWHGYIQQMKKVKKRWLGLGWYETGMECLIYLNQQVGMYANKKYCDISECLQTFCFLTKNNEFEWRQWHQLIIYNILVSSFFFFFMILRI